MRSTSISYIIEVLCPKPHYSALNVSLTATTLWVRVIYCTRGVDRWCQQLASVLAYLHSQPTPIIHRDLHPENVMLTHGNPELADICLIDFGLHRPLTRVAGTLREPVGAIIRVHPRVLYPNAMCAYAKTTAARCSAV